MLDTRVRVKFWFWIVILILGGNQPPLAMLTWVSVCFVSILVHEFGHVMAFRLFGEDAEVVLYAWGGLAVARRELRSYAARFIVSLAGPAAGFSLVGLTMVLAYLSGATIHLGFHLFLPSLTAWPAFSHLTGTEVPGNLHWYVLLNDLLFVNFYWGIVNLLPIYPLDGGQAARALFEQHDPYRGRRHSLILSAAAAGCMVLYGLLNASIYMILVFGILAASSLQLLESATVNRRPYRV